MIILYYHSVPSNKRPNFARQMAMLAQYAQVVPADWRDKTDPARYSVAITFDDAFTSVIDNALPELALHDFPCTIFVPSGVLGRNPDWAMEGNADRSEVVIDAARLRQLRSPLVAIGAHSVSHPRLTRIAPGQARDEIEGSRTALAELTGGSVTLFAFPYGDHDTNIVEICRQEGFKHVFTIVPEPVEPSAGSFVRGRVSVDPDDGDLEFFLKMSGAYAWLPLASALKRRLVVARSTSTGQSENEHLHSSARGSRTGPLSNVSFAAPIRNWPHSRDRIAGAGSSLKTHSVPTAMVLYQFGSRSMAMKS